MCVPAEFVVFWCLRWACIPLQRSWSMVTGQGRMAEHSDWCSGNKDVVVSGVSWTGYFTGPVRLPPVLTARPEKIHGGAEVQVKRFGRISWRQRTGSLGVTRRNRVLVPRHATRLGLEGKETGDGHRSRYARARPTNNDRRSVPPPKDHELQTNCSAAESNHESCRRKK